MKKWLQNIMAGRYGSDELSFTLLLIYLGICIFGIFCDLSLIHICGGFARSVGTHHGNKFTLGNGQGEIMKDFHFADGAGVEHLADMAQFQQRFLRRC